MPKQENLKSGEIPLLSFNSPQNFKQIEQKNPVILHFHFFIFSFSWRIASVMSYLCENEAENFQNGDFHLAQIPDFEIRYLGIHLAHSGQ